MLHYLDLRPVAIKLLFVLFLVSTQYSKTCLTPIFQIVMKKQVRFIQKQQAGQYPENRKFRYKPDLVGKKKIFINIYKYIQNKSLMNSSPVKVLLEL